MDFRRLADWFLGVRNRHVLVADIEFSLLAAAAALLVRTESWSSLAQFWDSLLVVAICFTTIRVAVFFRFKLYHRLWRYASIDELARLGLGAFVALVLQLVVFFLILRPLGFVEAGFPRSVPFIEALIALPLVSLPRLGPRMAQRIDERMNRGGRAKRVVVAGAGEAGVMIVREMQSNPGLGLAPVAFVDDSPGKQGLRIRGIEVLGTTCELGEVAKQNGAQTIVVAMPTATGKVIRHISSTAAEAGLEVNVVPGIFELLDGSVRVNQLRPIQVEDLLRRAPVSHHPDRIRGLIGGRRVLVTGAGGSIGSELVRQIARFEPSELVLVGHGENSIFGIEQEILTGTTTETRIKPVIANVRDSARLDRLFYRHRPEVVFHAAAHKHVPLMEGNPEEAVTNNILGTRNLLDAATKYGVHAFVMISTDKAVNPGNVMGSTKRIAEMLVYRTAERTGKPYMAVRFGNVLGSRGSVLQTFRNQVAKGGPLTVTHPDMKRYFMTIPEAVALVLEASTLGRGGEVFVLDMGEPVKISDLAKDVIRLSGLKEGDDIDIVYTGLRPGEKMFEELFMDGEDYVRTEHRSIFVCASAKDAAEPAGGDGAGGADQAFMFDELVDGLIEAAQAGRDTDIREKLALLVPTFGTVGMDSVPVIDAGATG
ncbi:MAG: polysaccharide biosynthesis protein [Rhodothermales bacterium]|nr:polysaccharide biosynthesis protein [Rhodothermales bacterium]MBO6781041.1 polysaccharide biosynthesis protein [Rhodothermales bacterium]